MPALHMEKLGFREPEWIALRPPSGKWQIWKSNPGMPNAIAHVTDHELIWSPFVFISCILFPNWSRGRGCDIPQPIAVECPEWSPNASEASLCPSLDSLHILGGRSRQCLGLGEPSLTYSNRWGSRVSRAAHEARGLQVESLAGHYPRFKLSMPFPTWTKMYNSGRIAFKLKKRKIFNQLMERGKSERNSGRSK